MALRQSHFRPGVQHRPGLAATACDVGLVGLIVVKEIELDELDTLELQLIERAVDPVRVGADHFGISQKPRRSERRGIASSPIIRPIQPRPLPVTLGILPPETPRGGVGNLPQEALLSGLRDCLNISLYYLLSTIFRLVQKDIE